MQSQSLPINTTKSPINHPKNQHSHSRKKATHSSEFVANRRLSYNRAVGNGRRYQYHWQLITAGSGVILQIASGEVEVPVLIGVDAIQAKTLLVQAGFLVKEVEAYDASQPVGVVIRQAPDAGTSQTIGKSVTITINKAP